METKEKETELVQLVRQLRDYVILDRKDYEKLVHNSSPEKFNESALESRDAQIKKNIIYLKQKSISRDGQKVIIDNSRGLRLGFFIELAEYFIFFIFKLLCVHKDEKQIFYICTETGNSNNCLPRLEFRI
jgi:hypothetical protein